MAGKRTLDIIIAGDPKGALAAFKTTEAGADGLTGKLGGLGNVAKVAGVAVAAGVVAAGTALYKLGETFDEQFDKIRVGTGATGDALKGLESDFKQVLKSVPTDFDSAGTAIADLNTRLGLTGKPLQEISAQFLELSRITGTEVAGNIETATGALNAWKIPAEKQSATLDMLFRASQATGASFSDLSRDLSENSTVFQALGFNVNQATTVLAGLAKGGLKASEVMPALGKAIATAAKEGKSGQQVYFDLMRGIKEAPDDTAAAAVAFDVLGAKAGPKFAALVRSGRFSFDELGESIAEGSDTILKAGKDTQDFSEKWTLLKNRVLVGLQPLAAKVFDAVGVGMDKVSAAMDKAGPKIRAIGDFVVRYKPAFIALAGVISGVLTTAFVIWGVRAAAAGVQAVGSFVAAQAQAVVSAATTVASIAKVIAAYVAQGAAALASGAQMAAAWLIGLGPIALVVAGVAAAAALIIANWDTVSGAIKAVWNWISDNWPLLLAIITGPIGLAVKFAIDHFDQIKKVVGDVVGYVARTASGIWNWITDGLASLVNGALGILEGLINGIISAINAAIRAYNKLPLAPNIGTIDHVKLGKVSSGPKSVGEGAKKMLHAASGAYLKATPGGVPVIAAEAGQDEIVSPVPMLERLLAKYRAGGGPMIYVDARGALIGQADMDRMVAESLKRARADGWDV
jgi:phage-related minor tail protein